MKSKPEPKMNRITEDEDLHVSQFFAKPMLAEALSARPILFSTEMVKAILENHKSQTRRVLKPQPRKLFGEYEEELKPQKNSDGSLLIDGFDNVRFVNWGGYQVLIKCLYKKDRVLWVRETFAEINHPELKYRYKADHLHPKSVSWKPSIFMPKKACRLFLKIADIRVERLQEISEEDAIAEGVGAGFQMGVCTLTQDTAAVSYGTLWEKINGKKSFDANPFVWAITFERTECPKGFC